MSFTIRGVLPTLLLTGFLATAAVRADDPSVILKSLDNLEKRIGKIEAETGKLKRTPAPVQGAAPHSDSAVQALSGRLDSLLLRLKSMEASQAAAAVRTDSAPASAPAAGKKDTAAKTADAELIEEIHALTTLLKQQRNAVAAQEKPVAAAPAPAKPVSASVPVPVGLELKGDLQIQGERKFTSKAKRDNLDDLWGRLNFGAEYNSGDFQSKVNIRIFPEGFGFEPLTGATFDTTGQGAIKVQTQPSSRIIINNAWAKYGLGVTKLKVGRFETVETQSENYGNYVDLAPSGKYMSRPNAHNAIEMGMPVGPVAASALLGTNDKKLDRGYLRLYGKYSPIPQLALSAGYRANVFDRFHYPDDEILQRFDAGFFWKSPIGWNAFAEAAVLQAAGREDDRPLLLGIQPKTGKIVDVLSLETEWLKDRKAAGKDKEWLFNVHARKALGRFKVDAGCYSDPADPDWNAFTVGLRMTSALK